MEVRFNDRIEGALLGTLIGDALGRPFEGTPVGGLPRLRSAVQRRVTVPRAWGYSDDGEMMLAVADSIATLGDVDEAHVIETMASSHEPARGYGKGARAAFRTWSQTRSWQLASRALWEDGSRGNGAAVRVAPVAIRHWSDSARLVRAAARRSALPTHSHGEAVAGAERVAMAVWLALHGSAPRDVLRELQRESAAGPLTDGIGRIDLDEPVDAAVRTLGHGVLAVESVPLAIWAHGRSHSFESAVVEAVCAGGDADTIGAMTGAMAGATYGASSIPDSWVEALERPARRRVRTLAAKLGALTAG